MRSRIARCAQQPDLAIWPTGYRTGLVEGLFLDREGYVDVSAWDAEAAAAVIAPVPAAGQVMQELVDKVGEAGWAYRLANDPAARDDTVAVMHGALAVLPDSARDAWGLGHHTPQGPHQGRRQTVTHILPHPRPIHDPAPVTECSY